jgi:kumamolisin
MPKDYALLEGSERRPTSTAKLIGPVDPGEMIAVTVALRRRKDAEAIPTHDDVLRTPFSHGGRLPPGEFAAKYGAHPDDIQQVVAFAEANGLRVVETHRARRTIILSGTAAQMSAAFHVTLSHYEQTVAPLSGDTPGLKRYRGRDGFIAIPASLIGIVVGVFGLDNRNISKRNAADPPNTVPIATTELTKLYNFPNNSASGQTIGIVSAGGGYVESDINSTFGGSPPTIVEVSIDGATNSGSADGETTQDICIASLAAPGADVAVYFQPGSQAGWIDLFGRLLHPEAGDAVCSVVSSSFYLSNGDDAATLAQEGLTADFVTQLSDTFQDAVIQKVTICIASGDTGSNSKVNDGKAHVQFPGSSPWVLAVGGTTVGNINGATFDEYVWNDPAPGDPTFWGTTGGGVSDFFNLPSYQNGAKVPASINNGRVGRGVPDVSANASLNAGYSGIFIGGAAQIGNGTSASAPLWAALIAVINAALGHNVGFVNPYLYSLGSEAFRDIVPRTGPADNSNGGVAGYPAGPGWDACTGWGSPNGTALLIGLRGINIAALGTVASSASSTLGR